MQNSAEGSALWKINLFILPSKKYGKNNKKDNRKDEKGKNIECRGNIKERWQIKCKFN